MVEAHGPTLLSPLSFGGSYSSLSVPQGRAVARAAARAVAAGEEATANAAQHDCCVVFGAHLADDAPAARTMAQKKLLMMDGRIPVWILSLRPWVRKRQRERDTCRAMCGCVLGVHGCSGLGPGESLVDHLHPGLTFGVKRRGSERPN